MSAAQRPFPPSPRRRALARAAGITAASPVAVAAAAWLGALAALLATGPASAVRLRAAIGDALAGRAGALGVGDALGAAVALAGPIVAAAAIAALVAHLAQIRTAWLPRRAIDGAPHLAPHRGRDGALDLARALTIAGVALGWLWWAAPRLAALVALGFAPNPGSGTGTAARVTTGAAPGAAAVLALAPGADAAATPSLLGACAALVASAAAALALAYVALAAIDALIRAADVGAALFMTHAEKREDDRLAAPDPRWRRVRERLAAEGAETAGTAVVIAGDDVAVAIAWDPIRRPVPARLARGTGLRATQLVARARFARTPIHHDPLLAAALARAPRAIPEAHWPRLAEIVAAVRR